MKGTLLFFILSFIYAEVFSQPSDFLVLKKHHRTVKSFFAGSNISFETDKGFYSGQITSVNKDSLFINQYDIRQRQTVLGIYVLDTVATYKLVFNYKDILKIGSEKKKGFNWSASGGSLFYGGILLTGVGLGTWVFTKPGTEYHASPLVVISGAALAGIGYLLLKSNNSNSIGKKYQLEYITVK
ncbi:MAG TPA: hypothetical protein VMY77_02910 [Chitinophagaceae bacterium]|nr:hypothetical protein [Chitinophagaceae bacterium]